MREEVIFSNYMELKAECDSSINDTSCGGGSSCYSCGDSCSDGGGGE